MLSNTHAVAMRFVILSITQNRHCSLILLFKTSYAKVSLCVRIFQFSQFTAINYAYINRLSRNTFWFWQILILKLLVVLKKACFQI